ncbi:MAG: hypothetical protein ACK5CS_08100 [Bradyrhizobium sp.]|jgi:hypothetical protein
MHNPSRGAPDRGAIVFSNRVFEIRRGGTPDRYVVDVKGPFGRIYGIMFVDGELTGRDYPDFRKQQPHIAAAVRTTLRNIANDGAKRPNNGVEAPRREYVTN